MSAIRVCERDGEPLVFTFEFHGAEYVCGVCGDTDGVLGRRVPSTSELRARLDELTETYEGGYAERRGVPYVPKPRAGDDGVALPICAGCGVQPEAGAALENGKPKSWFSRTLDEVTEYACSRSCIPSNEAILPW